MVRWSARFALLLSALLAASGAQAISIRHDTPVAQYNLLAQQNAYSAAGYIVDGFGQFCTGTLVSSTQVLTASHCVDDDADGQIDAGVNLANTSFGFGANVPGNVTPNIASAAINPRWVQTGGDSAFDVAVLTLSHPINSVTPASITGRDPIGRVGTMIGYGDQGFGDFFPDSIPGANDRLAGRNVIDASDGLVQTDFDSPAEDTSTLGGATPLNLEGSTGPGDSGGPLFVQFGDVALVVGTLNGGANEVQGRFDSEYGDVSDWAALRNPPNLAFLASLGITPFAPQPILPGDYNNDGTVDAIDYAVWRENRGAAAGTLPNDTNDGAIDSDQYATWAANFGHSLSSPTPIHPAPIQPTLAHAPEPASWLLLLASGMLLAIARRPPARG